MATQHIPVKVYYMENGANKEIRKFTLEQDVATNYAYLLGRIKVFFPSLLRKELLVYWKDEEGDFISISSDGELFEVMKGVTCGSEQALKLYIRDKDSSSSSLPMDNQHVGVVCDGCENFICGIRYKCTVCPDFDLCSTCESTQAHPIDHIMLCIKKPGVSMGRFMRGPWMRPAWKFGSSCNRPYKRCNTESGCSKKGSKSSEPCAPQLKEFIQQMATSCGFDSDVAASQMQSTLDQLLSKSEAESDSQNNQDQVNDLLKALFEYCCGNDVNKKEEATHPETEDKSKDDNAPEEDSEKRGRDENEEISHETASIHLEHVPAAEVSSVHENASTEDVIISEVEKSAPSSPSSCPSFSSTKDDFLATAVSPFLKQMGIADKVTEDQLQNIGNMMETVMQSIGSCPRSPSSTSDENKDCDRETERPASDGFVFVDEKNNDSELTEEVMFERRLNESLQQMLDMGFDNDSGWLKQLLLAKDLDISRVLDALKSSQT